MEWEKGWPMQKVVNLYIYKYMILLLVFSDKLSWGIIAAFGLTGT